MSTTIRRHTHVTNVAKRLVIKVVAALEEAGIHALAPLVDSKVLLDAGAAAGSEERVGIRARLEAVDGAALRALALVRERGVKAEEA